MTKRSLICGGAGFIGSHLCERLLLEGRFVICLDNLDSGRAGNVAHLMEHPRFEFRNTDIVSPLFLSVDEIYNLACPASPPHYQRDPVRTVRTSVLGTLNLLTLAEASKARLLHASTSEVYGDPEVHPQTEDYVGRVSFTGPRACYDEGKRCAETLCADFRRQQRADVRVARIFNTYGPKMRPDDGRVVPNLVAQALSGLDITIYGRGRQTRSFCYIDDMVQGLVTLMSHPVAPGPINLGNPNEVTILDLAERIIALTGSRSELKFQPLPADDPTRRRPDIQLARKVLGWQPKTTLDQGLMATITAMSRELARGSLRHVAPVHEVA